MKLLLVDGSNLMMRAAFGGEIAPDQAAPIAAGMIMRAARQVEATHMVVALDTMAPTWRRQQLPSYKANRSCDTSPWLKAGFEAWTRKGWWIETMDGFEADDIMATIAFRAHQKHQVVVCSNDSDVLSLTQFGVEILRPLNGGLFANLTAADVCTKYDIPFPSLVTDFKAMTGEPGDNVPGVPGIGPKKAAKLLGSYKSLPDTIVAGRENKCKDSALVAKHEAAALLAFKLVSLSFDVPIVPIQPKACRIRC